MHRVVETGVPVKGPLLAQQECVDERRQTDQMLRPVKRLEEEKRCERSMLFCLVLNQPGKRIKGKCWILSPKNYRQTR
jgi:hypothetical protein